MINKIKKWNWTLFFVMICCAEVGALSNKNIKNIGEAMLIGLISGVVFGLPFAIVTRDND